MARPKPSRATRPLREAAALAASAGAAQMDCFMSWQDFAACCCRDTQQASINPSQCSFSRFSETTRHACCSHLMDQCAEAVPRAREEEPRELDAEPPLHRGHPHCFATAAAKGGSYSFERCCNTTLDPDGDQSCWDTIMNFGYCCRPPLPEPVHGDPSCWTGALRYQHEVCCSGSKGSGRVPGPRGALECWELADRLGEPMLSARRCCDMAPVHEGAGLGGAQCLGRGHASSCSHPGVVFRRPTVWDSTEGQRHRPQEWLRSRGPLLRALPPPRRRPGARAVELLTLGVGDFAKATERLRREALQLGVFDAVHGYTDFSFAEGPDFAVWGRHMAAWRERNARIAGYGWWKPVLCRKHLMELPAGEGVLVFSDAGSLLPASTTDSWREVLAAMRRFDVLAVLEVDFEERRFTKRATLRRFAEALEGTGAAREGQFITGLFALRRTPAVERLLAVWERLAQEIALVDETLDDGGEDPDFAGHRHEQSLWSLLLKCGILGRGLRPGPEEPFVNLSMRVLTVLSGYESEHLAAFARQRD